MDAVKRAALRARRLQSALNTVAVSTLLPPGYSLKPAMLAAEGRSLRNAIKGTVQAFVSPALPIVTAEVVCRNVLVELRRNLWTMNARVEALVDAPTAFVLGFALNEDLRFGYLLGLLNLAGGVSTLSSATRNATVSLTGSSRWLEFNFETACRQGLTIRLRSIVIGTISPQNLIDDWINAFPDDLFRPMNLLDDSKFTADQAWAQAFGRGSLLEPEDSDDAEPGLSFNVSLRFD